MALSKQQHRLKDFVGGWVVGNFALHEEVAMLVELKPYLKPGVPSEAQSHEKFLTGLTDKNWSYESRLHSQSLFPIADDIGNERRLYHRGTMAYFEHCWSNHYVAVLTPDMLWYDLLCELATVIKSDPERFRKFFSETEEKQHIIVPSESLTVLPLGLVIDALRNVVPTSIDEFLPEFTTTTRRARSARYAAFCDAMSVYYNYSMYMCGIPAVHVKGTHED
ncbi:MAG: DUF4419 domain-containing protein, partial [Chloroflexi bacterium]|nr:DUF4419 domain-containing protein [Chloroflexota bacterium]